MLSSKLRGATSGSASIDLEDIGGEYEGGYLVGVIDTTKGNIIAADDYQTGLRYALIVMPKSMEAAAPIAWDTRGQHSPVQAGCKTRWNGLEATNTILAKNDDSTYPAFAHIRSLRTTSGYDDIYLPAMDELELMYRNLKPTTANNSTHTVSRSFPGSQPVGYNPSSDPTGAAYTAGSPTRTSLVDFQSGGSQSIGLARYWSSTDANGSGRAWVQFFTGQGPEGYQFAVAKGSTSDSVRPVRRVVL